MLFTVITFFVSSVSNASLSFFPALNDTAVVSLDPLYLSRYVGERASFTCNGTIVHIDSVHWTIDGKNVDSSEVNFSQGANPRELSPVYSTGAGLSLKPNAFTKYAQGVHKLELIAKSEDSLITAAWHFRCFETKYSELRATVVVDSTWIEYNPSKNNFRRYKIISAEPLDTSLFSNTKSNKQTDSLIKYDTASVIKTIVSSTLQPPSPKDTFQCFVLQILRGSEKYNEWLFSSTFESFVKGTNPPFELSTALSFFNTYAKSVTLPIGDYSPKGNLRLGPVFNLTFGDLGWSLKAYNDSTYWYFEYQVGSGDCPAGCINWKKYLYQVAQSGTVLNVPVLTQQLNQSRNLIQSKVYAGQKRYFTLNGQLIRNKLPAKKMSNSTYIGTSRQINSKNIVTFTLP